MCRYWMIVTMLHWFIQELKKLITKHSSDASELIKASCHGLPTPTVMKRADRVSISQTIQFERKHFFALLGCEPRSQGPVGV